MARSTASRRSSLTAPPPSTGLTGSRSPQRLAGTPGARVPVPAQSTSSAPTRPARRTPAPVCGCLPSQRGPVRSGRAERRLAAPRPAGAGEGPRRAGARGRGRRDRLVRRGGAGREGRRYAGGAPRGPARAYARVSRSGPASSSTAQPVVLTPPAARGGHRAGRGPAGGVADRERVDGGARPARRGGGGVPAVRRGPARRRAGREGLGRRPARRGRRRRDAGRRRRPARGDRRVRSRRRAAGWACSSTTSSRAPRSPASSTRSGRCRAPAATSRSSGHPYVDVWQSVRPARLGLDAWPVVPRGQDWKHGICAALGWPHDSQADIALAWKRILGRVRSYADLEPTLLGERRGAHRLRHRAGRRQGTLTRPCPDPGIGTDVERATPSRRPHWCRSSATSTIRRRPTSTTTSTKPGEHVHQPALRPHLRPDAGDG